MNINRPDKTPDTSRSIHLSASAGSGKTRALKDRYLALLDLLDQNDLNIDQAVAITFTDKAAAEIKKRVMEGLPEPMLKKIIRGRQDLRISTIHSFCMNLLKRYPLEAGLPPDFGILDERDQTYKTQQAIEETLEELDRDAGIMAPLGDLSADDLIDTLGFLLKIRSRLKRREIDAGGPEKLLRAVSSGMGTGHAENDLDSFITSAGWRAVLRTMGSILKTQGAHYEACRGGAHLFLADARTTAAASAIIRDLAPVYFNKDGSPAKKPYIAKKYFSGTERKQYEEAYFAVQDLLVRFRDLHARIRAGREAQSLLKLFQRAEERYQTAKLREGLLDFDDLEIYAYRLLRSPETPDILYWLDRKILHFLVDEFQDTSDIQWAVLDRLTEEIFSGQGADKPLEPTLFVVGDKKQSIYRFREANYRLIDSIREKMEQLPEALRDIRTLDKNYRSAPEIVDTVNKVFGTLWSGEYQPSAPDRKDSAGSVRLVELLTDRAREDAGGGATEADVLAREIRMLIESGTSVYERSLPGQEIREGGSKSRSWVQRAAGYNDCAILIQSRTKLKEYEAALQAEDVPFRVVGGIGFYEEDEVQAVLNVLFFLWNRDDRFSLAASLRSPLFGLTDQDILKTCMDGDMMNNIRRDHPSAGDLLDRWSRYALTEPLAGLVHRIIGDTGAYIRFGKRNPQAIFNLDKLLDTAREFDRRGYTTLQDLVEWVKNIRDSDQREAAADMNLPGSRGAVSIMTVHKAKGLEFAVVFLPGMNQQPRSVTAGPLAIVEDRDGVVRMAVKDKESTLYDELWEREQEELRREHQRLLYVAMTRARDHLVMFGTLETGNKPVRQNSWLSWLHQALPAPEIVSEPRSRLIEYACPEWQARVLPIEAFDARSRLPEQKRTQRIDADKVLANISAIAAPQSPEWKKAIDLIQEKEWSLEQASAPESGPVAPHVRGSIFHRCLEEYATTKSCDPAAVAGEFPEVRALSEEERGRFLAGVGMVIRSVTESDELAWIFHRQPAAYSELPFLYRKGNEIVSGIIDRVVVKDGRGYVVDYKTKTIENDEALQSQMDHYRPQVRIYCEAVKEMFRLEAVEGYLLFVDSKKLALTVTV
ncbi:MAG: UvrD-helicase domain-containing protein [Nitrospirota bacterium]